MTKSEMQKWVAAIAVVVVCSAGYMFFSASKEVPKPTEPPISTTTADSSNQNNQDNKSTSSGSAENKKPAVPESPKTEQPKVAKHNTAFGITEKNEGENVTIKGYITSISGGKGHKFPMITDPETGKAIKGVIFAPKKEKEKAEINERQNFVEQRRKDGKLVTIEGKVSIYNGEVDIIINKAY